MVTENQSAFKKIRRVVVGKERKPTEPGIFHHLTLGAFLAWIGLGSDGISSSCYGPPEAFLALGGHHYLGILLAFMTAVTVFVISTSYKQIIQLFPSGGGGYIVASKLLSPKLGMFSGCALLVDYVLTIGKEARKSAVHSPDKAEDTAIILVNGFTNTGLHTLFTVQRLFKGNFKNFVFLQAGLVDTGRFKSSGEIENLKKNIGGELKKYVELMQSYGYYAESCFYIDTDVVNEIEKLAEKMAKKYPRNMLFTGQVVFPKETFFSRLLHNYTAFAVQKRLYKK